MSDDAPRPVPARRGFSLFWKGRALLSTIDPEGQAERAIDGLPDSVMDRTLFFIPSPLLGYGINKLLSRTGPGSAILCAEADRDLLTLSKQYITVKADAEHDASPGSGASPSAFPQTVLAEAVSPEQICALVRRIWGPRRFRRVLMLRLGGGWQLAGELYGDILAALEADIAGDWENALTLTRLGRRYIMNFIQNLPLLVRAGRFPEKADTAPVLVLGAGPSLDGLLDALAARFPEITGRGNAPFSIFVVDTALRPLLARHIFPDLVIALESQHWNLDDFSGAAGFPAALAMDMSALPATARVLAGETLLFFTPWTELRFFARIRAALVFPPEVPALGSVGLTAAALALRYTSGPVISGGLDFSFSLDRYHARGTPGSEEVLLRTNRMKAPLNAANAFRAGFSRTAAKNGETVISGGAFRRYRDLFAREFSGSRRLFGIKNSGLDTGIPVLEIDGALEKLAEKNGGTGKKAPGVKGGFPPPEQRARLSAFIEGEREKLREMRDILGGAPGDAASGPRLETLIDECDYLWAHFPECSGAGGRRPVPADKTGADSSAWLSFIKRIRVELDPFIRRWDLALGESVRNGG